jgi:hypothetical protein
MPRREHAPHHRRVIDAASALTMSLEGGHPYVGARAALVTLHGKERVVGPALRERLAAELEVVRDFDTDTLGTFTREVPRLDTQLDAARRKAALACERSGLSLGLGSEGAFVPAPLGLGTWNVELVVWLDTERGVEVVGRARDAGLHHHDTVRTLEELADAARRAEFPQHGLALRPHDPHDRRIRKGLRAWGDLEAAFRAAQLESPTGAVFVENDLRAHQHPSRMAVIARAMIDLVERLARLCPACATPGFGRIEPIPGLPCGDCGTPTKVPLADLHGCVACETRESLPRGCAEHADPSHCDVCNP